MSRVCGEKQAPDREKCEEVHYNVLPKVLYFIHVITYFSFVENVSLKHELCAVNNAA